MHGEDVPFTYGFWFFVLVNVGLFAFFLLSFLTPVKKREWRSMEWIRENWVFILVYYLR